ncbi:MAG: Gfo/Idh/MocA family oxidoreductase [Proteobacteria bacterium]|nr:Gfo/Idh/MocA family oxidoreductase [Pseudomonadota bacterium]
MRKLRTAVVGGGHFGRYHADKYAALPDSDFVGIVDPNPETRAAIAAKHKVAGFADAAELVGKVDAVSVVVPTVLHFDVALKLIEAGIHVLIEKPIAETVAQADRLIEAARAKKVVLQVGHLQRFLLDRLGVADYIDRPLYIEAARIHAFSPRATDVSVILDLMIHDIDLVLALVGAPVESVMAVGTPVVTQEEDIANVRLGFTNGCVANITTSRVSLNTERRMRVFGHECYVTIDLAKRKLIAMTRGLGESTTPGMPPIDRVETEYADGDDLKTEIASFLAACRGENPPRVSGEDGRNALDVALRIETAIRAHRARVMGPGV